MSNARFETFDDFWPHYLGEHADPTNRWLHVGGLLAAAGVAGYALATRRSRLLPIAPAIAYGAAWIGHFFVEKNKPMTFKHPIWSARGDLTMTSLALTGRLDDELARFGITDEHLLEGA